MGFTVAPAPNLRERTTLHLGGHALAEVVIADTQGLERLPEKLQELGGTPFVIGGGSNLLARDGELELVLLRMKQEPEPQILRQDAQSAVVSAPVGMRLQRCLHWLAKRGLSGLEGLSGVPGNIGGAVAMNAGSFGSVMGDQLHRVQALVLRNGAWKLEWLEKGDFCTAYRRFSLQHKAAFFMVTAVELELKHGKAVEIAATMRENLAKKKASQPITAWTAGCAFKNPAPDAPAGMLLDKAGMKGAVLGGMTFSTVHANFLVNTGTGTSDAALELLDMAKERVFERFGHKLELEVKLCPDM